MGKIGITFHNSDGLDRDELLKRIIMAQIDTYSRLILMQVKRAQKDASERELLEYTVRMTDEWAKQMFPELAPEVTCSFSEAS